MRPSSFTAGHRLWVASLLAVFALMVGLRYEAGKGLTALIQFDAQQEARSNPVLRTIPHHVRSPTGFDGQFYAQIALDPLLRDPATQQALDAPAYRARRILMPLTAWAAGLGRPGWIIAIYPCLNVVCWLVLFWLLLRYLRPVNSFQRACLTAVLFTSGMLETVRLALPDLPATVLMVVPYLGVATGGGVVIALACACLCRETCALGAGAWFVQRLPTGPSPIARGVWLAVALLPLAAWLAYVRSRYGADTLTGGNIGFPLQTAVHTLVASAVRFATELSPAALGAVAAVVGLHVQAAFFWVNPRWQDPLWRLGAAFSVLLVVLGPKVWELPLAACRDVLPLTVAFNVLLLRHAEVSWKWWAWGNAYSLYGVFKFFTYAS